MKKEDLRLVFLTSVNESLNEILTFFNHFINERKKVKKKKNL